MYGGVCCVVCGSPEDDDKMILCDGCDKGFHLFCLRPQLAAVPVSESWFCSDCVVETVLLRGAARCGRNFSRLEIIS